MDMRTPLSRVGFSGSAHDGTSHFWRQRLTALANVPLVVFMVWLVTSLVGADRATIVAAFANPFVTGLTLLTLGSVCLHMKLGMQVIIEDYVHSEGLKLLAVIGNIFFAVAVGVVGAILVLKIGFGG